MMTRPGVCLVGYALNKKKMRRSDAPTSSPSSSSVAPSFSWEDRANSWRGGGLADLLYDTTDKSVCFQAFDFESDLDQLPEFDVIIHKLTEDIRGRGSESSRKIGMLMEYMKRHPNAVLVDPIEAVRLVICRNRLCLALQRIISQYEPRIPYDGNASIEGKAVERNHVKKQRISGNHGCLFNYPCPFSQPFYVIVNDTSKIVEIFQSSELKFPVICKPLEACGTPTSHTMVVAVDLEGLLMVDYPTIIQEYKDHNMSFYKVYVIDEDVMVYQRPSLPNLQHLLDKQKNSQFSGKQLKSIVFDSRYAYPTEDKFFSAESTHECTESLLSGSMEDDSCPYVRRRKPSAADLSDPNPESYQGQFEAVAAALRQELGLTLFGFDCIIPSSESGTELNNNIYDIRDPSDIIVIDVNFFPSYKEVEDFPIRLKRYLKHRAGYT